MLNDLPILDHARNLIFIYQRIAILFGGMKPEPRLRKRNSNKDCIVRVLGDRKKRGWELQTTTTMSLTATMGMEVELRFAAQWKKDDLCIQFNYDAKHNLWMVGTTMAAQGGFNAIDIEAAAKKLTVRGRSALRNYLFDLDFPDCGLMEPVEVIRFIGKIIFFVSLL